MLRSGCGDKPVVTSVVRCPGERGTSFSVRRVDAFLRNESASDDEHEWVNGVVYAKSRLRVRRDGQVSYRVKKATRGR